MTLPISDDAASPASGLGFDDQGGNAPSNLVVRLEPFQTIVQRPEAPAFSQFATYVLTGLETQPIQILTQAPKRKRAYIRIMPALVSGSVAGYVIVGTQSQVQSNRANLFNSGGLMACNTDVEVTGSSPLYLLPDGINALTVLVLDERYQ